MRNFQHSFLIFTWGASSGPFFWGVPWVKHGARGCWIQKIWRRVPVPHPTLPRGCTSLAPVWCQPCCSKPYDWLVSELLQWRLACISAKWVSILACSGLVHLEIATLAVAITNQSIGYMSVVAIIYMIIWYAYASAHMQGLAPASHFTQRVGCSYHISYYHILYEKKGSRELYFMNAGSQQVRRNLISRNANPGLT